MSKQQSHFDREESSMAPPIPMRGREQRATPAHGVDGNYAEDARPQDADRESETLRHRFLSPAEWAILAHGIGGVKDAEHHSPTHPANWWWPPKGMPRGLYRDVVTQRAKCFYLFHSTSILRWLLMILQLFIGAALTAIGSLSFRDGTPITVLGAGNTVIAGLLALLHNSGLPDRYRHDMAEFEQVEDHIKELLDTGIAPADVAVDQTLARCFDLYQNAKATVAANMPVTYNSAKALWGERQSAVGLPPRPVSMPPRRAFGREKLPEA